MKFVKFSKYKAYLGSLGYVQEPHIDDYASPLAFRTYYFSKPNVKEKYGINVYTRPMPGSCGFELTDNIMTILYGCGSIYAGGIKKVNVDMRTKFWKQFI